MRDKVLIVVAVTLAFLCSTSIAVYSDVYHGLSSLPFGYASSVIAAFLYAAPVLLCAVIFKNIKVTLYLAYCFIFFALYKVIRLNLMPNANIGMFVKLVLAGAAVLFSTMAVKHFNPDTWRRVFYFTATVAVSWVLSTPIISLFNRVDQKDPQGIFNVAKIINDPPKAVVILVLDELSPEKSEVISSVLRSEAHTLYQGVSLKAGKDTINAIPGMLTHQRHDDVRECGALQLCGAHAFSPLQLKASDANTDIVGFYHPYCSIQGLRSCWSYTAPTTRGPFDLRSVLEFALSKVSLVGKLFVTDPSSFTLNRKIRDLIEQHALSAPFWTQGGGVLYIHHFLPHPAPLAYESSYKKKLANEYQDGVIQARDFVSTLRSRLRTQFHDDYALIITSDHPLRTSHWCGTQFYASDSCAQENLPDGEKVPFMVFAPKGRSVSLPSTNVGVFAD